MKKSQSVSELVDSLSIPELKRLLVEKLTTQKLGLVWEHDSISRDEALNSNVVLPRLREDLSVNGDQPGVYRNMVIEGDNFDSLRLLRTTHANKIRVIYIDPPYNTGNKDWVYNDRYVGDKDRWRHSQWLEFLYQRLTLARELLTPDGVILVSINDENRSRLEMLMDEVFPSMRLGSMVWRTRQGSNADQQCFLSVDHEHVLVYGNPGFAFKGFSKTYEMYGNPDNDPRGDWTSDNLTLGFSYKERPNLYYPLVDPMTGVTYPCSPDSVWRYATESRLKSGQTLQAKSIEEFIRRGQILFPQGHRVETWHTLEDLLSAIDRGDIPKSGKTAIFRRDLPDLEQWVGKPIGFGRPRFKRYKADLRNLNQPLSSWVVSSLEEGTYEAETSLISATNQEGARQVSQIFGDRAFNYAKPTSLIKGLLAQATRPDDIVLDFFAGSGTTGQVVMELNAQDGGRRQFILCSSTEANDREPTKNLCRDICAERLRRVIRGYSGSSGITAAQGGSFAYVELDKLDPADARIGAKPEQTFQLLSMRNALAAQAFPAGAVKTIAQDENTAIVYLPEVTPDAIVALQALPQPKLVVYSNRPQTVAEKLERSGKTGVCYSAADAIIVGQGNGGDIA